MKDEWTFAGLRAVLDATGSLRKRWEYIIIPMIQKEINEMEFALFKFLVALGLTTTCYCLVCAAVELGRGVRRLLQDRRK